MANERIEIDPEVMLGKPVIRGLVSRSNYTAQARAR